MSKKILLAGGCSFTDKRYRSPDKSIPEDQRGGWEYWPELMAKELDLECINVGLCGRGADFIFNEVVKQITIYGDRIDTVAVLWSGSDRTQFHTYCFMPIYEIYDAPLLGDRDPLSWMDEIGIGKINRKFWNSPGFHKGVYYNMMENQLIKMVSLFEICKARGIKLIMAQGVLFLDFIALEKMHKSGNLPDRAYISRKEIFDYLIKNPLFQYLEENKNQIIGWPFYETLGGTAFSHIMNRKKECYISPEDHHPNALGQQVLSEYFIKKHRELYV